MPKPLNSKVYPLAGLPRQGQIWSWISYDVANQSFTLLINTLLFPIFLNEVIVADEKKGDTFWSVIVTVSMLLVVAASPFAGAIADARAWKKRFLLLSGLLCGVLTCAFGLIQPGQLWLVVLLYIPANFMFNIGENFLASFLPEVARREDYGKVSGFSWGVAYSAALLLLVVVGAIMKLWGLASAEQWRPIMVFAGAWFIVFSIPTLIWLREAAAPTPPPMIDGGKRPGPIADGLSRLKTSIHNIRAYRDLVMLLIASFFYGGGMMVIIFFASLIAKEFGFEQTRLVGFVAVVTVSGVLGTVVTTFVQDRIGHKLMTITLLLVWIITAVAFSYYAFAAAHAPKIDGKPDIATWPLWLMGNLIGFGLGSLGSANRAFVGALAPPEKSGEVFGLWGMVFKLAAVLTLPFAIVRDHLGTPSSLMVLAGFFVVGLVLTLLVNQQRGEALAIPKLEPVPAPPLPLEPAQEVASTVPGST